MRVSTAVLSLFLLCGLGQTAVAADASTASVITVSQAWVRATVPGQSNGAGYLTLANTSGTQDKLISVSSNAASKYELHEVIMEGGNAKMREVAGVIVPANGSVTFAPGGYHIMFLQLANGFKPDAVVSATLKFEHAGEVQVSFEVKPPTYNPNGAVDHQMHGTHDHMSGMMH